MTKTMIHNSILNTVDKFHEDVTHNRKLKVSTLLRHMLKDEDNTYSRFELRIAIWHLIDSDEIKVAFNNSLRTKPTF